MRNWGLDGTALGGALGSHSIVLFVVESSVTYSNLSASFFFFPPRQLSQPNTGAEEKNPLYAKQN